MTRVVWDQIGKRTYQTGVDRGVLYVDGLSGVPWNGLTSVEEDNSGKSTEPYYFDGVKMIDFPAMGDFAATIKAITYPDEFERCEGIAEIVPGLYGDNQSPLPFGLTYRTLIGNDVDGVDHAYKIHIWYNMTAVPANVTRRTLGATTEPHEFSWSAASRPERTATPHRPTGHVILDSRRVHQQLLSSLEDILYGTATVNPRLPSLSELITFIEGFQPSSLVIVDNGDGTWTAIGDTPTIQQIDATTFEITSNNIVFLNPTTYQISSS